MKDHKLTYVKSILSSISCQVFDKNLILNCSRDIKNDQARLFIQVTYVGIDNERRTFKPRTFKSRKWYLSDHMTEDEIVKTAYLAYEICVRHEVLEGFRINGKPLFNPHADYRELLKIDKEVKR